MSDLQRIGDGLEAMLRRLGLPAPGALDRVIDEWATLAGGTWAERSTPVGFSRGELVVEVADGATASLLRYQVGGLLDRLEQGLGARLVETVRLTGERPAKGPLTWLFAAAERPVGHLPRLYLQHCR